jgi:hypothetical protein
MRVAMNGLEVVKTLHSCFPKQDLENALKTWSGGVN